MRGLGTIEQTLTDLGRISEEVWKTVKLQASSGNKSVWKTAVALGYVSESEVLKVISEKFNLKILGLNEIPASTFDLSIVNVLPSFLSENNIYPILLNGDELEVVVCDPASIPSVEAMFVGSDKTIKVYLSTEEAIHHAIERSFGTGASVMDKIVDGVDSADGASDDAGEDPDYLSDLASGAPVIKLVNLIISRAIESEASDIHIEPYEEKIVVRYRIDGILHDVESPPAKMKSSVISRIKIMAKLNIAEKRLPQDGRIRTRIGGKDMDMRISTLPTVYGESVVMRILDRSNVLVDLGSLGFPEKELEKFNKLISKPYGMFLVTGPTGSGKTTTLYGALDKLNTPDKKIITIEDPVEYQMDRINQMQVRSSIGLTFQNGLRSIVRQDPDTIMVGEIRDVETAQIAIQAALTGHMVFSTVHTNDSAGAITRLLDMGVEHYLISSALIGAMAQRLVRVLCEKCKEPFEPDKDTLSEISGARGSKKLTVYKAVGCGKCADTGYKGRIGIFELLAIDDGLRNMILSKTSTHIIKDHACKAGLVTLREDGWEKVGSGRTSIAEVLRVTTEESG